MGLKSDEAQGNIFTSVYVSFILSLVIFIPLAYTVVVNIQGSTPAPDIQALAKQTTLAPGIEELAKLAQQSPGYETFLNLGLAYYNIGSYKESIDAWNEALKYNSNSAVVHNNIAASYGALKMWDEEIAACEKALAIDPNLQLAKGNMAWAKQMKSKE